MDTSSDKRSQKAGVAPGTVVHVGARRAEKVRITVIDYGEKLFEERVVTDVEECRVFKDRPTVTWINIDGLHDIEVIEKIGRMFGIHPLVLEDIVNTHQRPKMENYNDYIYCVVKMITHILGGAQLDVEQVSFILGKNFLISFQEKEGDVFESTRERIRSSKGRVRSAGPDYLLYSLIDAIVDNYFTILENLGEQLENLEARAIANPTRASLRQMHSIKTQFIYLRKAVWPLREVLSGLQRAESSLIAETTGVYLRDAYDHTIQVIDNVETLRDMATVMMEIYVTAVGNKLNEIMKVVTIIATLFMPITFLASLYGMNFEFMPLLHSPYGFPIMLVLMLVSCLALLMYFRKKRWI